MELYTNGIHRGTLHIKKQLQNKDKTLFFTKMLRPGEQAAPANKKIKKKIKIQGTGYCTYKTESASLSTRVHDANNDHTKALRSPLALLFWKQVCLTWSNTSNK